jgi:hypothetical protein
VAVVVDLWFGVVRGRPPSTIEEVGSGGGSASTTGGRLAADVAEGWRTGWHSGGSTTGKKTWSHHASGRPLFK